MPPEAAQTVARKPQARSRVSNGSTPFLNADGRSRAARRWVDVNAALLARLEALGPVHEYQIDLIGDAATLRVSIEIERAKLARGELVDLDVLTRALNALQRLLIRMGLDLKPKRAPRRSALTEMVRS